MKDIVVFAGPSISPAEVERIAPFAYRPPAAQGDVYLAVRAGARAIGLIDGFFEGVPAVWHKEILFALGSGVHVFGASSMGALRAAELHGYGMRGVGQIFDWYAAGTLDADDEVALVHAPAGLGYIALSVPLVNVRATLDTAVQAGAIGADLSTALLCAARSIHFKDRTWGRILDLARLEPPARHSTSQWLSANAVDQKKLDARAMIEAMAALAEQWPGPFKPDFVFEPTDAWNAGVEEFHSGEAISDFDQLVVDEARIGGVDFQSLFAAAAITVLAASARVKSPADPAQARRIDRFRKDLGLQDRVGFEAWIAQNELDERELGRHLASRALASAVIDRSHPGLIAEIVAEIKLRGHYAQLAERAMTKAKALSALQDHSRAVSAGISQQLLLEWYFERRLKQSVPDDLDHTCRTLALPDVAALRELIAREYLTSGFEGQD